MMTNPDPAAAVASAAIAAAAAGPLSQLQGGCPPAWTRWARWVA
jgi:hypothetical protein